MATSSASFDSLKSGVELIGRELKTEVRRESFNRIVMNALQTVLLLGATIALFSFSPLAMVAMHAYSIKVFMDIAGGVMALATCLNLFITTQNVFNYFKTEKTMNSLKAIWLEQAY